MSHASAERTILPRPLRLHLDGTTPRHWITGDPVSTQLFNALSIVFPRGEKMFVEAVRAHKDRVRDPRLVQAVRDFIGQEVNHSRAHVEFNDWLTSLGLPVAEYAANLIKKSVVGAGHADKTQVQAMVRILLPQADVSKADAADALAIAICHAHHRSHRALMASA